MNAQLSKQEAGVLLELIGLKIDMPQYEEIRGDLIAAKDKLEAILTPKFNVATGNWGKVSGTHLVGYLSAFSYHDIVSVLGEPSEGDGYKTDAEWIIEGTDGTVATIYNWKNGRNYNGDDGWEVEDITEWNVGGLSHKAIALVEEALNVRVSSYE